MTRLTKPVTRETDARGWRGRRNLIVSLLPGGMIELRKKWGLPPGPTHWLDRERARKERRSAGKHAAPPVAPAETPAESAGETSP